MRSGGKQVRSDQLGYPDAIASSNSRRRRDLASPDALAAARPVAVAGHRVHAVERRARHRTPASGVVDHCWRRTRGPDPPAGKYGRAVELRDRPMVPHHLSQVARTHAPSCDGWSRQQGDIPFLDPGTYRRTSARRGRAGATRVDAGAHRLQGLPGAGEMHRPDCRPTNSDTLRHTRRSPPAAGMTTGTTCDECRPTEVALNGGVERAHTDPLPCRAPRWRHRSHLKYLPPTG